MGQENSTPSHPVALASSCTTPSVFSVRPISQLARRRASRRRNQPQQPAPAEECASTSMTEKEEFSFVACRLCQGLLNVPKLLNCWHPFCLPCLTDYKNSQTEQGSNVISCPICQQTTPLPSDGIGGLRHKANVFLSRVADLSSFIETYHNTIFMKHYCPQQARFTPSNRTCKQCKDFLCQECSVYHLLQHTSATKTCRRHHLPTNVFCESCNIVVCGTCAQAAHTQHATSEVDLASENYRDILGQLVERCKDLKWPLEESLEKNIQETRFQIQNSTEALISHVTQFIRRKEQFLLSELEQFSTEMKGRVESEKEKYTPLADQCQPMCELGDRLVRFGSNHELLSVQQEMTRLLTEASIEQTPQDISESLQERIKFIPDQLPNLDNLLPLNVIGTTGTYTEPVASAADSLPAGNSKTEEAGPSTKPDGCEDMSAGNVTEDVTVIYVKEEAAECTPENLPEGGKRKRKPDSTEETTTEGGAVAKKLRVVEVSDDSQEASEEEDGSNTPARSSDDVVELESPGNQEFVSGSQEAVPGNQEVVSESNEAVPGSEEAVSGGQEAVLGGQEAVPGDQEAVPGSQEVAESAEEVPQTPEEASDTWEDASDGGQEHVSTDVKEEVEEHTAEEVEKGAEGEGDGENIAARVRGRKKGWLKWW